MQTHSNSLDKSLTGALTLAPGTVQPIRGGRPVLAPGVLDRLAAAQSASRWPTQLGNCFALCGPAQMLTSELALQAAGALQSDPDPSAAATRLRLVSASEQLQGLVLDWPLGCPLAGLAPDIPLLKVARRALQASTTTATDQMLAQLSALERSATDALFAMPPVDWLHGWLAQPDTWLNDWSMSHPSLVARWLTGIRANAQAIRPVLHALPCPTVEVEAWSVLGASLLKQPQLSQIPLWQGRCAETGPWCRSWMSKQSSVNPSLWWRLGARLADLAALLSYPDSLRSGQLALAPGVGLGWCEMSRGLLVHVVHCNLADQPPGILRYRILAPTEWNFHPNGALAQCLQDIAAGPEATAQVQLAATTFSPCVSASLANPEHNA